MALPAWDQTRERLEAAGASGTASQCHGVLCGLLAAGSGDARDAWLAETVGDDAPGEALESLYDETRRQLGDSEFGFELLLPDDDEASLEQRTRALSDWAGGFSFGVVCAGLHPEDLPSDVAEFLRDAGEIAGVTPGGEDEGDEADYAEIVEYLRAGTLLMRTQCVQGEGDGGPGEPSS